MSISIKWYYVIFTGLLIHGLTLLLGPTGRVQEPDARSAIQRAKTNSCKRELSEFSRRVELADTGSLLLERSCNLDKNVHRNSIVDCIRNTTDGIIEIDATVENTTACLDICFSYGHSHGGYDEQGKCYCGDKSYSIFKNHTNFLECSRNSLIPWFQVNNGIYYPPDSSLQPQPGSKIAYIKIVFLLILSGRDSIQVKRLFANIHSNKHLYYLHVDKSDEYLYSELINQFKNKSNVIFSGSRFRTIWGGTSLLRMVLNSMKDLVSYDWDYLINLSGSDFPLRRMEDLESFLSREPSSIYLKAHNLKGSEFVKKQGLDRNFYECEQRVWRLGKRKLPKGIIYTGGSDWFALTKRFVSYIDSELSSPNRNLVNSLFPIYNHTLLPVESFFHTVALNSEYCDKYRNSNLHLTNWNREKSCKCQHRDVVDWCGCSPLVFRTNDWERIQNITQNRNVFFARKFDPAISSSIINNIEQSLLGQKGDISSKKSSTKHWKNVYLLGESSKDERLSYGSVLEEFGLFVKNQTGQDLYENYDLESVDLYFNDDQFIGVLLLYCDRNRAVPECEQFLVERSIRVYRKYNECLNTSERTLEAIEIGSRFDAGERLFRDNAPINYVSDIAVFHQWRLEGSDNVEKNFIAGLKFLWFDPMKYPEMIQDVKLKRSNQASRVTLAHRLNIPKPIMDGVWTLIIRDGNRDCLKYEFVILGPASFREKRIQQDRFDQHYRVTGKCGYPIAEGNFSTKGMSCKNVDWSTLSLNE